MRTRTLGVEMVRRKLPVDSQDDLFSVSASGPQHEFRLSRMGWPDPGRFPVNHSTARVRQQVWEDLVNSKRPLVVAGWASIEQIVNLISAIEARRSPDDRLRILVGSEPFASERARWNSAAATFTAEARSYWAREGVSLLLSAKVLQAIGAIEDGWLDVRAVTGLPRLHAKVYVADGAVTVGSSNFTQRGLSTQMEANVRFTRAEDAADYGDQVAIAENYWSIGEDWREELTALLRSMLTLVSWQEALARACASLLEGQWADLDLGDGHRAKALWPHQVTGVAQALWVIENVGSVLVADPTGSGKTKMGAQLLRAVRDRLLSTGRIRDGLCTMVCPGGAVLRTWTEEAADCDLPMHVVSDTRLSRSKPADRHLLEQQVARAQVLALDEGHRFLNRESNRTLQVLSSSADHVVMFTATPINREVRDLLAHVDLLGADNFPEDLLELLVTLNRRRSTVSLTTEQRDLIRGELQRFIVRRTKQQLNQTALANPDLYRDPKSGRVSRYPDIAPQTYSTGETFEDSQVAEQIRAAGKDLKGLTDLAGSTITKPDHLLHRDDADYLRQRLGSAQGLTQYRVLSAMRSSKAALLEHLVGTTAAITEMAISRPKPAETGDVLRKTDEAIIAGPPTVHLGCDLPDWLLDRDAWEAECQRERSVYQRILDLTRRFSTSREESKAAKVCELAKRHDRILVFEYKPITAAYLTGLLEDSIDVQVLLATGHANHDRDQVEEAFRPDSTTRAIGVCTDAMNEGLNLQGASTMVHLDYPTTLRVAEQRVGRIVRMNSPHDRIETWWPHDSAAFRIRQTELIFARQEEAASLLGATLDLPPDGQTVDLEDLREHERRLADDASWDGIASALDPVRSLVAGPDPLVPPRTYEVYREITETVRSRVSLIKAARPWAFLAIEAPGSGVPRWILLENDVPQPLARLEDVAHRLRQLLADDPPSTDLMSDWGTYMETFLKRARRAERDLLPRKLRRALEQMHWACRLWAEQARRVSDHDLAIRWEALAGLAREDLDAESDAPSVDLYQVANIWLRQVKPMRDHARQTDRRARARRYSLLSDVEPLLGAQALDIEATENAFAQVRMARPLDRRITACILGVPDATGGVSCSSH